MKLCRALLPCAHALVLLGIALQWPETTALPGMRTGFLTAASASTSPHQAVDVEVAAPVPAPVPAPAPAQAPSAGAQGGYATFGSPPTWRAEIIDPQLRGKAAWHYYRGMTGWVLPWQRYTGPYVVKVTVTTPPPQAPPDLQAVYAAWRPTVSATQEILDAVANSGGPLRQAQGAAVAGFVPPRNPSMPTVSEATDIATRAVWKINELNDELGRSAQVRAHELTKMRYPPPVIMTVPPPTGDPVVGVPADDLP